MTIEEQLQQVIHDINILREMFSYFSPWDDTDKEWVLHNTDQSLGWFVVLQESMDEKSQN